MRQHRLMTPAFCLLLACALLLTACGGNSGDSEGNGKDPAPEDVPLPVLKVGLLGTSIKPAGVLTAEALGYFAEEGVEVEFEKVSSMNDAYIALSTGDLDVYLFSSTAAASFISQGTTTLRVFGGTASEGSEIMAAAGTPEIRGEEDLVGKTVACQMPETGQMVLKNYLLEQGYTIGAPGEGADVAFVYVNDANTAVEGCVNGEYDYCITNSCLGYYAEQLGAALVGSVRQFVETYPCCRQTCSLAAYEEKREALTAFETAALRGYRYNLEHPEETLDLLEAYAGEERDFLRAQVYGTEAYTPVMRLSLDPDRRACIAFYEAMASLGEIPDAVEVNWEDYVVTDIYDAALGALEEREPEISLWQELRTYFETHN